MDREFANKKGYHVCAEYGGHGIGTDMHMPPLILHCSTRLTICVENRVVKASMEKGMTFTIEPILLLEKPKNYFAWQDNWTSNTLA